MFVMCRGRLIAERRGASRSPARILKKCGVNLSMSIFNVLTLLGGLAFFLYGGVELSEGLIAVSGNKLERMLAKLTSNRFKGLLLGTGVTSVIQSSSATTVMLVGLVNAGIMTLRQTIPVIMGANIGTTVTAWILSLAGITSENVFIQLLKPTSFAPMFAVVGIILHTAGKSDRNKSIGRAMIGFALLMHGMDMMSTSMQPLADTPGFSKLFTAFSNPILGVIVGAVLTGIIQSSSASVGILQALSLTGAIGFSSVIPIILGQNIGTCVTALLSSIGTGRNARRCALVHFYFNVIGTILFMTVFYTIDAFYPVPFMQVRATPYAIAIFHTVFNVLTTSVLLPFTKQLERLAILSIPYSKAPLPSHLARTASSSIHTGLTQRRYDPLYTEEMKQATLEAAREDLRTLDDRFLNQPTFAVSQSWQVAVKMLSLSQQAFAHSMELLEKYDESVVTEVFRLEDMVDHYEDGLGSYLVKVSARRLNRADSRAASTILHLLSDFERISDHAVNIAQSFREMQEKDLHFSCEAVRELETYAAAVNDILARSIAVFRDKNVTLAATIEPLEEVTDNLTNEIKGRHIRRLRAGLCTIELGFILTDLCTSLERVADHCSNIAATIIEMEHSTLDTHMYLHRIKHDDPEFRRLFLEFQARYVLPMQRDLPDSEAELSGGEDISVEIGATVAAESGVTE